MASLIGNLWGGKNDSDKVDATEKYYSDQKPGEVTVFPYSEDATSAWKLIQSYHRVDKVNPQSWDTPQPDNHVRFVCVSDTHSRIPPEVPDGDVLLHTGDFTMGGAPYEIYNFNEWLGTLPHKHKIVIAGNHDSLFDYELSKRMWRKEGGVPWQLYRRFKAKEWSEFMKEKNVKHAREFLTNCIYLEDAETSVCGIRIYGSPWQPAFHSWGFNLHRGNDCLDKWKMIPKNVDILMTHGPPVGHGDLNFFGKSRAGCVELLHTIQNRVKPKYHVFGHIHEGAGVTTDGLTTFVNASTCNRINYPVNPPIIFDFPIPDGHTKDELLNSLEVTACDNGNTPWDIDWDSIDTSVKSGCTVM